ncbi:MAG: hypothetical protein DRN15_05940 [Thermoprotei archaeon]|nr:MAG: hypothetical protein DRN15_05940 [Thermoprotei archaeon]
MVSSDTADLKVYFGDFKVEQLSRGLFWRSSVKIGPLRAKLLLRDLSDRTELLALSPRYRILGKLNRRLKRLIFSLMELKLLQRRHSFLHAACLDRDGEGLLIVAPPDTGKTHTSIILVRDHDFGFLSDDMVIVGPSSVAYCFPTSMTIHVYHLKRLRMRISMSFRLGVYMKDTLRKIPYMSRILGDSKISYDKLIGSDSLIHTTRIRYIFVLKRGGRPKLTSISKRRTLISLCTVGRMHRSIFEDLIMRCAHEEQSVDLDDLYRVQRNLYEEVVNTAECFQVTGRSPEDYADIISNYLK